VHVDALTATKCGIFASAKDRTLQLLSQFLPGRCQDLLTQGSLQWQWKATLWNKDLPPCRLHGDFQGDRTKHQLLLLYLCNDQGMKTPTWSNLRSCVYFEDFIHTAVQVHNRCCTLLHTHTLHCSSISEVCIHWYSKSIQIVYTLPIPALCPPLLTCRACFSHALHSIWSQETGPGKRPNFQSSKCTCASKMGMRAFIVRAQKFTSASGKKAPCRMMQRCEWFIRIHILHDWINLAL